MNDKSDQSIQQKQTKILYKPKTIVDYINILRRYWLSILVITLVLFGLASAYAFTSTKIYKAETTLKISPPEGNILDAPLLSELSGNGNQTDRFIANEIHTMKNIAIRERVAEVLIDTVKSVGDNKDFSLFTNISLFDEGENLKNKKDIVNLLRDNVKIEQVPKLDFIQITSESSSPYEAALIANTYANVYREFNLLENRKQVSQIKDFLKKKKDEKFSELKNSENEYKIYQLRGGAIELDAQAKTLIETMTEVESRVHSTAIDLAISKETLDQYKSELQKQDLSVSKYLESKANEPLLKKLQEQLAEVEAQKQLALASNKGKTNSALIKEYDKKIESLKNSLQEKTAEYQNSVLSASPEQIKEITQKIFEEEVKYNSLKASHDQLTKYLKDYTKRFDSLPERSIDLARLERQRLADEKIYMLLEEKYQEALINEQATLGTALILNSARIPNTPASPNKLKILFIGLILGVVFGFVFALIKDHFDKSVKSPEEIEDMNVPLLGWIPKLKKDVKDDFVISNISEGLESDSFKSLRTVISFKLNECDCKTILITSSAPGEGKSLTSLNLAGSFAFLGKKTVIVDFDFRKPRIHSMLNTERIPGFTEFFTGKENFDKILKSTIIDNLFFIPSGAIPKNPTEILDSKGVSEFIKKLEAAFDIVIIDSPPLFGLADSLIISKIVDITILVAKAEATDTRLLKKSISMIKNGKENRFGGVILNNFDYSKSYGSYYYKYAYSYVEK